MPDFNRYVLFDPASNAQATSTCNGPVSFNGNNGVHGYRFVFKPFGFYLETEIGLGLLNRIPVCMGKRKVSNQKELFFSIKLPNHKHTSNFPDYFSKNTINLDVLTTFPKNQIRVGLVVVAVSLPLRSREPPILSKPEN